jgi:hypothetical protein
VNQAFYSSGVVESTFIPLFNKHIEHYLKTIYTDRGWFAHPRINNEMPEGVT